MRILSAGKKNGRPKNSAVNLLACPLLWQKHKATHDGWGGGVGGEMPAEAGSSKDQDNFIFISAKPEVHYGKDLATTLRRYRLFFTAATLEEINAEGLRMLDRYTGPAS